VFYCAADVFSTASDLSLWAHHLYEGNAISEDSKQKMLTSYVNIPHLNFIGYGLGVRQNVYAGRVMWGHTGGMRGYGSHMFWDPVTKVSIAILNNQSRSANGPTLRHELMEELMREIFQEL
jgi:D-alanyl-D-alanine carboxypeptidase